MTPNTIVRYLEPTREAGRDFVLSQRAGGLVMLNLLRFRKTADYAASPQLAPVVPVSGEAAFRRYVQHTLPYLQETGGDLLFLGSGGCFLIGPAAEYWDWAMLVRQHSVEAFLSFATHEAYLAGLGHRMAALEDSRLLPLTELSAPGTWPG